MTVDTPERAWTDERLDDLSDKVDDGFAKVDAKMDAGFAKVDADIREVRTSVNQLMWGLLIAALGIIGTMIGTNAS